MPRIGEMRCLNPECSCNEVAVSKTTAGNLSATCHKCGCPTFAKAGTAWRRTMEARVRLDQAEPPPKDGTKPAAPAPAPPAAKRSFGTLLG